MQNTGQYKFTARKIIEKLSERLRNDPEATYADWLITLMREGFKKDDAIKAFRKSNFVLLQDGTIIDKKELHKLKNSRKLVAENPSSRTFSKSKKILEFVSMF